MAVHRLREGSSSPDREVAGLVASHPVAAPLAVEPAARSEGRGHQTDGLRPRLQRAITGLAALSVALTRYEPHHGFFGTMSLRDWQRWAYRHTHYHLRQFGL